MKWSNEYKVHYYYTDYNTVLKSSYIARYMQETAWYALKNWGPTPEYLTENNLAFILIKINFKYYEEIHEDDTIKVQTWANPPKGLIFPRNYRIYKGDKIAAEAVSSWVLMDSKDKNIVRPDDYKNKDEFMAYDDEELDFTVQRRIKMPEDMNEYDEYKVKYSDIDTNFHMNNVAYIDVICNNLYNDNDIMSPELKKKMLSLELNYINEAKFAQTIEINKGTVICSISDDNKGETTEEYYMKAKVKGSEHGCFEAKVVLTNK